MILIRLKDTHLLKGVELVMDVTGMRLDGTLLMGMRFAPRPPGVMGGEMSFAEEPNFDFELRPFGVPISDFPGISEWLQARF